MTGAIEDIAAAMGRCRVVDLSPPIRTGMPQWCTHGPVRVLGEARTVSAHGYYSQDLHLPEHSGAHVDAPAHVLGPESGMTVDAMPPLSLVGRAVKVDLSHRAMRPGEVLGLPELLEELTGRHLRIEAEDIVLFEFGWDGRHDAESDGETGAWGANAPGLDAEVCEHLHDLGVRVVGSDTPGVDIAVRDGEILSAPGHRTWFLPRGIFLLEGLRGLASVPAVSLFLALPLRIARGSGSPIRALALFE